MVRTKGVLIKNISHILKRREPITLAVRNPAKKINIIVATTPDPGILYPKSSVKNGERRPSMPVKRKRKTRMVMISGTITKIPDKKYRRKAVLSFFLIDIFRLKKLSPYRLLLCIPMFFNIV